MKNYKKLILVGQLLLITSLGVVVDNTVQAYNEKSITPYVSQIEIQDNQNFEELSVDYIPKKAEEIWAIEESKYMDDDNRLSDTELATLLLDGDTDKIEKFILIDNYNMIAIKNEMIKIKNERIENEQLIRMNKQSIVSRGSMITSTVKEIKKAKDHIDFKSYMPGSSLAKNSPQGELVAKSTKDTDTAILKYDDRYLVALGYAYAGDIGTKIDVIMESGEVIPAIVGDWKAIDDTDDNSTQKTDGSIIEFIVSSKSEAADDVDGSGSYNCLFPGKVKEFRILD